VHARYDPFHCYNMDLLYVRVVIVLIQEKAVYHCHFNHYTLVQWLKKII